MTFSREREVVLVAPVPSSAMWADEVVATVRS
jgi:hypothetical protein